MKRNRIRKLSLVSWRNLGAEILILALILLGCEHSPLRGENIATAEIKVASAVEAGADKFAPEELKKAKEHIVDTQRAIEKGQYQEAHNLIDKSILLATLAEARARQKSAEERYKELQNEMKQLQKDVFEAEANLERTKEQLFKKF